MFDTPTNPMKPEVSVDKLLENMSGSGFQGRKLGESFQIWKEMIETPGIRIIIGLSGAIVPAGMQECIIQLIENRYVDAVNPENFTACLDLGHCGLVGEDCASMIRDMGSRLGCLHIHDNDHIHDSHTLPYLSKMDWTSILEALADIDYKGNFTYEADSFLRLFPDSMLTECEKFMCGIGRKMIEKINEYKGK